MKKNILILVIFVLSFLLFIFYFLFYKISSYTHTRISHFPTTLIKSYQHPTLAPGFNFVMLGVDPRDDQLEKTQVSDSIIVGRLTSSRQVKLISIPRDLWVYSLETKVNQIYPLSQDKVSPVQSYQYIEDEFTKLTGQKISRTLILTTDNLIELTKIIGGVDVVQESTYTDLFYPNPEYVKNPSPKIPIYKTVIFPKGLLHLDESNITEYVRSRKGQNEEGSGSSDQGRIQRQQLLLEALISKLKSPAFISSPTNVLTLYNFWHQSIRTNISDSDLFSLLLSGKKQILGLTLTKTNVPVGENPKKDILYHPRSFINRQWVYIPVDKEYKGLQEYISGFLNQ
ncbi:LCP family protein [Candidatus Shapirobacteria bacterium]|nr:LCP family protein [Candidatus Shapirobacteria bacterium]